MIVNENGFLYHKETKIVVAGFLKNDDIYKALSFEFFYGTKQEAIEFGLIFNED